MAPDDPDNPGFGTADTPPTYEAVRTAGALYVEYRNGEREFYDLERDPAQTRNQYLFMRPARRARLANTLHRLRTCRGPAACWRASTEG